MLFLIIINFFFYLIKSDEIPISISNKRELCRVSDKLLSISIDPGVLIAGVNFSESSFLLAKHLSPAYIRLAGPSTSFVQYLNDNDNANQLISHKSNPNIFITPAIWFGINEWFNLARLTPVFGINDIETDKKGVWNPTSTLPLLEMSDKFSYMGYWQLGFDCSNKTIIQYMENLNALKQTLSKFKQFTENEWKIIGSDLSKCSYDRNVNSEIGNYINDLNENVKAVMWESSLLSKSELGLNKAELWAGIGKDEKASTFQSAMEWLIQVEQAAIMEYNVVFKEARFSELFTDSPLYWVTFLHKKLMGSIVLDVKSPIIENAANFQSFAHCAKGQSKFLKPGAITVLIINNGTENSVANIRLSYATVVEKTMEIQSYFVTALTKNSRSVYLNNEKLTINLLQEPENILKPKLKRIRTKPFISLEVPGNTIAFFVLTGARFSLCNNNEEELNAILKEINNDQKHEENLPLVVVQQRNGVVDLENKENEITLESIKRNMLKEFENDRNYRENLLKGNKKKNVEVSNKSSSSFNGAKDFLRKRLMNFVEKSKKEDLPFKKGTIPRHEITSDTTLPADNLYLSMKEVSNILKDRAKSKAAEKNIKLTSSELDLLINKATIKLPKPSTSHHRKRDINWQLLEDRANQYRNNAFSQEFFEHPAKHHHDHKSSQKSSVSNAKRPCRSINKNIVAFLEENKNKWPNKRDINLDLLKRRMEINSSHDKKRVATNKPNSYLRKYFEGQERKQANIEDISDEGSNNKLYKNFMNSDALTVEDFKVNGNVLADLSLPNNDENDDYINKKYRRKLPKHNFEFKIARNPKSNVFSNGRFQILSSLEYGGESPVKIRKLTVIKPYTSKNKSTIEKSSEVWATKKEQINREKSVFNGLDAFNIFDEFNYQLKRKKRSSINDIKQLLKTLENKKLRNNFIDIANIDDSIKKSLFQNNLNNYLLNLHNNNNNINDKLLPLQLKPLKPVNILTLKPEGSITLFPLYQLIDEIKLQNKLLQMKYLGIRQRRKRRYASYGNNAINDIKEAAKKDKLNNGKSSWEKGLKINEILEISKDTNQEKALENGTNIVEKNDTITTVKNKPELVEKTNEITSEKNKRKKWHYLEELLKTPSVQPIEKIFKNIKESVHKINKNFVNFWEHLI